MSAIASNVPAGPHRAELRGRAAGTSVMAFFALGWTACGVSGMPVTAGRAVFAAGVVITVIFAVLAARMSRRAADAPTDDGLTPAVKRTAGRRFALIFAAELIAIFVIARVLVAAGHPRAIPAVIAIVVGVHFFPLARLFGLRLYHVTGTALCACALATLVLTPLTSTPTLWTLLPGFGSALTLYTTSVCLQRAHGTR